MHCFVRQITVYRAGNVRAGEVKVIGASGSELELLYESKLCRQPGHIRRNVIARCVELAIAAKPHKVTAAISIRAGQTVGGRRSKCVAIFHNNLNILRAAAQFTAAKVEGNSFQPVRAQRVRVQDLKNRAETDERKGSHSIAAAKAAGRIPPAKRTVRHRSAPSILSPRRYLTPVFDIPVVLVQYPVPFVALGRATFGIARVCTTTSRGRRTQCIAYATGCVIFAKNQTRIV